jgi:hypothetical protein
VTLVFISWMLKSSSSAADLAHFDTTSCTMVLFCFLHLSPSPGYTWCSQIFWMV